MLEQLQTVIDEYTSVEKDFNHFFVNGDGNKETLLEFERRFLKIKSDVRPIKSYVTRLWTNADDKSSTAIKFRIANAIMKGEFIDSDKTVFEQCSITAAEKFASASKKYKKFIEQRAIYREALSNVSDIRDDINGYVNLIKDRLK